MSYKKIILIATLSILLFSCDKSFKEIGQRFSIKKVKNEEMEKYNSYIEIYNKLSIIDDEISSYIEAAGENNSINIEQMKTLGNIPVIKIESQIFKI